jgi:hypothetical protein
MNSNSRIILLVVGASLLLAVAMISREDSDPGILSFDPADKSAYGSSVLAQMLQEEVDSIGFMTIEDSLQGSLNLSAIPENSNYIFVGKAFFADSSEIDHLLQFVKEGGQAYIISNRVPNQLLELFLDPNDELVYDEDLADTEYEFTYNYIERISTNEISAHLAQDSSDMVFARADFKYVSSNKFRYHPWAFFDASLATEPSGNRTGYFDETYLNFFEGELGKGRFSFHSNPEFFANYYLLERENQNYQRAIFKNLGSGNIYWDVVNHQFQSLGSDMPDQTTPGALVFILSQPALKYAWYLLLLGALTYLLLGARRAQSALRVINPNENTSIEYSTAIAELYLQKNDHRKIGLLEIDLFKTFLRERYGMSINRDNEQNEKTLKLLALKSNIELEHVNLLFAAFKSCRIEFKVSDENLAQLHHDLNHFYTHCK